MATIYNYALKDIGFSHTGAGDTEGRYKITHVYRAGCTHVPVINLGTGNAAYTALSIDVADTEVSAATDAKHTVCTWAARDLTCVRTGLLALDASGTILKFMDIGSASINNSIVNLGSCPRLYELKGGGYYFSNIDLTECPALEILQLQFNKFTSIDLTQNVLLKTLWVYSGQLTALSVAANVLLVTLQAENNKIPYMDLSANTVLKYVELAGNYLGQTEVNQILSDLDANGVTGGILRLEGQSTGAVVDASTAAATAAQSLIGKGWSITYDGTFVSA